MIWGYRNDVQPDIETSCIIIFLLSKKKVRIQSNYTTLTIRYKTLYHIYIYTMQDVPLSVLLS